MKELGLFGATIPAEYGGLGLDVTTYAMIVEELCVGWMSLSGILNTHLMLAYMIRTARQRGAEAALPARRWRAASMRGALCLTEAHAGSDVQRIRTTAVRTGDDYVVNGSKMFVTNARYGNLYRPGGEDRPEADPPHKGMSLFIAREGPRRDGQPRHRQARLQGRRHLSRSSSRTTVCRPQNLLGGVEGQGMQHVMNGLEVGRINIAARAVGVARAAFEAAIQLRAAARDLRQADLRAPGDPAEARRHGDEDRGGAPADATRPRRRRTRGERCDLEAGMAKLFASETCAGGRRSTRCASSAATATRKEFPVERFYRDAPLMIIGEGTNEIQRTVIATAADQALRDLRPEIA